MSNSWTIVVHTLKQITTTLSHNYLITIHKPHTITHHHIVLILIHPITICVPKLQILTHSMKQSLYNTLMWHHLDHHIEALIMTLNPVTSMVIHPDIYRMQSLIHHNMIRTSTILWSQVHMADTSIHIKNHINTPNNLTKPTNNYMTNYLNNNIKHHHTPKLPPNGPQTNNNNRCITTAGSDNKQQKNNLNVIMTGLNNSIVNLLGQQ